MPKVYAALKQLLNNMEEIQPTIPSPFNTGNKETICLDPNILELRQLLGSSNFQTNFLDVQTRVERKNRDAVLNTKNKDGDYQRKLKEANDILDKSTATHLQNLNQLKKELENPTAELIEAFTLWGRSRNANGEFGPTGIGYNSGVIHYFEYRTHVRKNQRRFKPEDAFTIDGFIACTKRYYNFLKNPSPSNNPQIEITRLLEDATGNRRLYILTKEGEFIAAFQRSGQEMKILSVFFEQNISQLNERAEEGLNPTIKSENRFNRLEGLVTEIPL